MATLSSVEGSLEPQALLGGSMKRSRHFDIWEWVDFVRGTIDDQKALPMQQHLTAGCKRCGRMVRVLNGIAQQAALEARYEPADAIVRRAQAIFPLHRPEPTVFARLVYDSFREPMPAGLRAEDRLARHALYEAGDLFVDLELQQDPGAGTVALIGQISDRTKPRSNTTTLPVLLMAAKGLVASAMCNHLGEFEMEYRPARDLRLYVPLRDTGGHLEVRMDELAPGASRRARRRRIALEKTGRGSTRRQQ